MTPPTRNGKPQQKRAERNGNAALLDVTAANELTLLGSMIAWADKHPGEIDAIGAMVDSTDFYDLDLGALFELLQEMRDSGEPIGDAAAVRQRVVDRGLYEAIGKAGGLGRIIDSASSSPRFYAAAVRRAAHVRRMRAEAESFLTQLDDPTVDHYAQSAALSATLDAIASRRELKFKFAGELANEILDDLEKPARPLIFTGLEKFDRELGGFAQGELVVLCARTSVGKSALAAQIAEHNARRQRPVLFITLEMDAHDIVRRFLARDSAVGVKQIRAGGLDDFQRQGLINAAGQLQDYKLCPQYMPTAKVSEIRQVAKAFAAKHGIAMLVVDYLQIIAWPDSRMGLRLAIADATRKLKQLAGELGCPVLALSQLNRASTTQERPTLANLSESGSIEADADMVLAIHRLPPPKDAQHYDPTEPQESMLLCLKNRNGLPVDLKDFWWNGPRMEYYFAGDSAGMEWQP